MTDPIRVGLVGAHPSRGWAAAAHLPALGHLPEFRLAAVATTRMETAAEAARLHGAGAAFGDWRRMLAEARPEAVIVAVKVSFHREIVLESLAAGAHVFCEWPLGLSAAEAEEMRAAAEARGLRHMVGLQSHAHPVLAEARRLVAEGAIGRVVSATLVASLGNWWPEVASAEAYRFDPAFGATGLTVPGGHSLDAFTTVLGPFATLSATLGAPHREVSFTDTGERRAIAAPTQLALSGLLRDGAVASLHVKPDVRTPAGIRLEVNGTRGDLRLATREPVGAAPVGIQRAELTLDLAREGGGFVRCDVADPDAGALSAVPGGAPRHTARLLRRWAAAIRGGRGRAPDFATACALHRLVEAAAESARTGRAVAP